MRVSGDGPRYVKARQRVIYDLDEWAEKRKRRFTGEADEDTPAGDRDEEDEGGEDN